MPEVRGITIAVGDWYANTLRICLHQNMRHLTECLVVTAPGEEAVKEAVARVPGARVFETDAFTRPDINGIVPRFNKGLAMCEGLTVLGLEGWIWIFDGDICFPPFVPLEALRFGCLHGCGRRILDDPATYHLGLDWMNCPRARDGRSPVGYTQIFHADDPAVKGKHQLYDVSFEHAGGGDASFLRHWPPQRHVQLPMDVLHLGRPDMNWFGTSEAARDTMARYVYTNQWPRAMANHSPAAAARGGELPRRLHYEGYEPSTFQIPFERRAAERRD